MTQVNAKIDVGVPDARDYAVELGQRARAAARALARAGTHDKDRALNVIADTILDRRELLATENAKDIEAGRGNGLSGAAGWS